MAESDKQNKTEEPTPTRLKKAREEGNVPKSQEVASALLMLGAVVIMVSYGDWMYDQFRELFRHLYLNLDQPLENRDNAIVVLSDTLRTGFTIMFPMLVVLTSVAILANVGQTGIVYAPKVLEPKGNRISPIQGFKKIFSIQGIAELVKGLSKIAIVGIIIYVTLKDEVDLFKSMMVMPVTSTLIDTGRLILLMFTRILSALIILAIADSIYTRFKHQRDLRMTRQEVKDEFKQAEGDPHLKGKRKEQALGFSRRKRLDHAVLASDVVITNPTHYSVALSYDPERSSAPVVRVKGVRKRALRIREFAREYNVPIMENPPVARALYATTGEGETVPEEHFQIIAEILAYVYRLKENEGAYGN
ncbi:flagellar biosynthesis protein FlhB [Rhodohalobacter mucosus]|uniref:Flagellar biosynthetic protein FlhB n=1 Tax=Rhodohalobacter mucosus TaxID=2079485 RepID=A0A316TSH2_9BACT|nr:flagellar biosynthesis protein FlhB [Rhodohalobacter mucosus]PWN05194.1 flagellar biosynthesis protein FlhB [Rhodohalobacter mucosus]